MLRYYHHASMKLSNRIYAGIFLLVVLWCGGILAAPILKHLGWEQSSEILYALFSRVCHQDSARSFFLCSEPVGVCYRCSAIYFGFFIGMIILPVVQIFLRRFVPGRVFFAIIFLPMTIDVLLNVAGIHGSTVATRIGTGLVFGAGMPLFLIPMCIEACLQLAKRHPHLSLESGAEHYVRKTQ